MIEGIELTDEEMEPIRHLIPGPEPRLVHPNGNSGNGWSPGRILPVADVALTGNELQYLSECIRDNWISSGGGFVTRFEAAFANAMGCRYGVASSSGTTALHLIMASLGTGPGDEVIVPTFTMVATANCVSYTGASPVLVDAEPDTWNMDPDQVEACISERTTAVIVVHTYGHPAEMARLEEICERRGIALVEDAAEAHGAKFRGRQIGSFGQAAAFSFYGNKIITTGEGGMVTTNDAGFAALARRLRGHAFSEDRHFWHKYMGFNYRMSNVQAAIGLAQTERLNALVDARRANRTRYEDRLRHVRGLTLPIEREQAKSVFWMYSIVVEDDFGCCRDELRQRLAQLGVETRTHFVPIHLQPIYRRKYLGKSFPVAESLCRKGMYLPSGPTLTGQEIDYVCDAIVKAQRSGSR